MRTTGCIPGLGGRANTRKTESSIIYHHSFPQEKKISIEIREMTSIMVANGPGGERHLLSRSPRRKPRNVSPGLIYHCYFHSFFLSQLLSSVRAASSCIHYPMSRFMSRVKRERRCKRSGPVSSISCLTDSATREQQLSEALEVEEGVNIYTFAPVSRSCPANGSILLPRCFRASR